MTPEMSNGETVSPEDDRRLFLEEVGRIVTSAAANGDILQIGRYTKQLGASALAAGFAPRSIADELIRAASSAGVPVEMDRYD